MAEKHKTIEKQKRRIWLLVAILIIGLFIARHFIKDYRIKNNAADAHSAYAQKIAVIGNNLVEICLSLKLQDSLVAIGYYGKTPEKLKNIQNLGVMNISEEQLIKTKPNLVIASESAELKNKLQTIVKTANIKKIFLPHENFTDVINAIQKIAAVTGKTEIGNKIVSDMKAEINIAKIPANDAPTVLMVTFAQKDESGGYNKFYCAGKDTFLDEILRSAGGKNALPAGEISWPALSVEEIIKYNPDVIIDLRPDSAEETADIIEIWGKTTPLQAVQNNKIFVLKESFVLLPSPQLIQVHKLFKKILSP